VKQTSSKFRAHVGHVNIEYVCFMFASSCKRGISHNVPRFQQSL